MTVRGLLIGCGVGLLVLTAGCGLAALCVNYGKLPEEVIRYCAWIICALSAFAGCMTAQRLTGKANIMISLGCALLLLLGMLAIRLAMKAGEGWSWTGAVVLCLAAVAAAFVRAGRGGRRR